MLRSCGGGTCCVLLLFAALAAPASAALTPVLGASYVATQITFNSGYNVVSDGNFTSATWRGMTGSNSPASTSSFGLVWDVSNNSIAYVLSYNVIRVVNFANPTSPTAITTLSIPGYPTFPNTVYGPADTSSLCGDRLSPQTLYVTRNYNGFSSTGSILAIKLNVGSRAFPRPCLPHFLLGLTCVACSHHHQTVQHRRWPVFLHSG